MSQHLREQLQLSLGDAYTLGQELSGGGMSRVFVAEERALHRKIVVKVLPDELAGAISAERFRREIQVLATLQHPNIVPVLRASESAERPYYIMPFVQGDSLRAALTRRGRFTLGETLHIIRDIASALTYAHGRGIVHRDIKPENVLLCSGAAVLTDFGIAKALGAATAGDTDSSTLTATGVAIGTPAYMSPEQVLGESDLDGRSDVYSLGCLAYELLSGEPPFRGRVASRLLAAHVHESPPDLSVEQRDVPQALRALLKQCLAKTASERPMAAAVLQQVDDIMSPRGDGARLGRGLARSRRTILGAVIAAVVIIAVGGTFALRRAGRGPRVGSIALLPLSSVGADSASQWMADGATEELTTALGRLSRVRVVPPTSAAAAVARVGRDPQAVARLLGVTAVLEGSMRRTPRELRLTMRLVDASDGSMIWSQDFSRALVSSADLLAVQSDIASRVAEALRVGLEPAARNASAVVSLAAHDLYLRGRYFAARYTEPDLRRAIQLYDSAVALEPRYAMALAAKGEAWSYLADTWVAPREAYPKANGAVQAALKIDSTLAHAWAVLANIAAIYYWNPDVIRNAASHAMAEDSTSSAAILAVASELMTTNLDSALALLALGERRDPLNPLFPFWAAATDFALGRNADGCSEARRGAELAPGTAQEWMIAECLIALARYDSAVAHLRAPAAESPQLHALYARALALAGHRAEARAEVTALEREGAHRYVSGAAMAGAYAALGDHDAAFRSLDRAVSDRAAELAILPLRRMLDPLRSDLRYQQILAAMRPLTPGIE